MTSDGEGVGVLPWRGRIYKDKMNLREEVKTGPERWTMWEILVGRATWQTGAGCW